MVLADTGKALLTTAGIQLSRTNTLLGLTSFCLLPLCLLKNLASLAPFSLLGVIGMGYTCFAMIVRFFGGSYTVPTGALLSGVSSSLQPTFGTKGAMSALSPNSFILICMLRYVNTYLIESTDAFSLSVCTLQFLCITTNKCSKNCLLFVFVILSSTLLYYKYGIYGTF